MSSKAMFKVFNDKFFADKNLLKKGSFAVKSIPRQYNVFWDETNNPAEVINKNYRKDKNDLLLIDKNVYKLFSKNINVPKNKIFIADASEDFKTIKGVMQVIDFMQKNQITKAENLIVAGGGIIEDVGAFVGAVYKRGIPWIYIPTTLLSMCDSCIGGKTGINHGNAKNQLALFSAPSKIIINPNFLKTLDDYAIKAGMGEILKLVITGGNTFLDIYKKNVINGNAKDFDSYKPLILAALAVKKSIVEFDEFELNHRRSLNYGHTVGHVAEGMSNYAIPHGQAVVIGMIVVNGLSEEHKLLKKSEKDELDLLCKALLDKNVQSNLKTMDISRITELLKKDKKTLGNTINFVVIKTAGDTRLLPIELNKFNTNNILNIIKAI